MVTRNEVRIKRKGYASSMFFRTGTLLLAACALFAQGRLRAPEWLPCDRNDVTSYTGEVSKYSRTKTHAHLTIRTDEDTTETVKAPIATMRWRGEPFRTEHWKELETRAGELRGRTRVTAWVCKSGATVADWLSPQANPSRPR
ncbi:MAG: hypothetical protein ACKV2U_19825 [Bryobacteraceae bacterium]